ncbi:MAG: hypothetical protein J2P52_15835 [Blastocatellia bacterium]|nr:hypothetical protein [Blastocatellia bacterium]
MKKEEEAKIMAVFTLSEHYLTLFDVFGGTAILRVDLIMISMISTPDEENSWQE